MSPAYESANLILKLYDLRREEVMRKAREWYRREFHPESAEDVVNVLRGEHSDYFRMVTSYWEMAASFVNNGVIDWKMFMEANPGEPVNVFAKLYPYLKSLRSMFASKYDESEAFQHLEQVMMKLPYAEERVAETVEQVRQICVLVSNEPDQKKRSTKSHKSTKSLVIFRDDSRIVWRPHHTTSHGETN